MVKEATGSSRYSTPVHQPATRWLTFHSRRKAATAPAARASSTDSTSCRGPTQTMVFPVGDTVPVTASPAAGSPWVTKACKKIRMKRIRAPAITAPVIRLFRVLHTRGHSSRSRGRTI